MAYRMNDRLTKLERQSPDDQEAAERGMGFLREALRKAEEQNGPTPPSTPEDKARIREFWIWLCDGHPELQSSPLYEELCGRAEYERCNPK